MPSINDLKQYMDSKQSEPLAFIIMAILLVLLIILTVDLFDNFRVKDSQTKLPFAKVSLQEIPDIAAWHLFGEYTETVVNTNALPETSLNLKLVGTIVSKSDKNAVAVIGSDSTQKLFSVGDEVQSGVVIYQVLPYSVILKHNGRLEVLSLPVKPLQLGPPPKGLNLPNN